MIVREGGLGEGVVEKEGTREISNSLIDQYPHSQVLTGEELGGDVDGCTDEGS